MKRIKRSKNRWIYILSALVRLFNGNRTYKRCPFNPPPSATHSNRIDTGKQDVQLIQGDSCHVNIRINSPETYIYNYYILKSHSNKLRIRPFTEGIRFYSNSTWHEIPHPTQQDLDSLIGKITGKDTEVQLLYRAEGPTSGEFAHDLKHWLLQRGYSKVSLAGIYFATNHPIGVSLIHGNPFTATFFIRYQ